MEISPGEPKLQGENLIGRETELPDGYHDMAEYLGHMSVKDGRVANITVAANSGGIFRPGQWAIEGRERQLAKLAEKEE